MRKKRQPSNENVKLLYNIFRNWVNRDLKKSKKSYYVTYFEEHCNNIKLTINNRVIDVHKQVANEVNNFFVNVGPNTEKSVPKVPNIPPENFLKNRNQFNLTISHISNEEVLKIINSLSNKTTGPTSIPLNLLHSVADIIVFPLCYIINMSFSKGIFPGKLKIVKVVPLHKGGTTP